MGYELHVTRKNFWADEDGPVIAAEEWLSIVERDPDLSLDLRNGPYHARWGGPSKYDEPWIDWAEGELYTKNPDPPLIAKLLEIAGVLSAKVRGDDNEVYTSPTEYHHDDIEGEHETQGVPSAEPDYGPMLATSVAGPPAGRPSLLGRLVARLRNRT